MSVVIFVGLLATRPLRYRRGKRIKYLLREERENGEEETEDERRGEAGKERQKKKYRALPVQACRSGRKKMSAPEAAPAGSSSGGGVEPPIIGARAIEGEAADAFADGLMGLLTPLVHKCDEGVQAALDSQAALSQQIDRVTTCPCTRASIAAHSYSSAPQLATTPRPVAAPYALLRRSQPSYKLFSARRRSPPLRRTRRSCRVCAGGSLPPMARCSRCRLDWLGWTA